MRDIVFSTETLNDRGFTVPNDSFDFSVFEKNPLMLYNHGDDDEYKDMPIGHWENIRLDGGKWMATPVFSSVEKVQQIKELYEEGNLRAASIGAKIELDKYSKPNPKSVHTLLLEISIVPRPSNPDAVQANTVKLYSETEYVKLSAMGKEKEKQPEPTEVVEVEKKAEDVTPRPEYIILNAVKEWGVNMIAELKALVTPAETPTPEHKEPEGDELPKVEVLETIPNTEIELTEPDGDEPKVATEQLPLKTELCDEKLKSQIKTEPMIKTPEELAADNVKLAAKPEAAMKLAAYNDTTIASLKADKQDGARILGRVMSGQAKDITDYQVVLNAMLNDPRYAALASRIRITESGAGRDIRGGSLEDLRVSLNAGAVQVDKLGGQKLITKLSASDDLLTTPDLQKVVWSSQVFFALLPTDDWKSRIPVQGVQMVGDNIGYIWTNVGVTPTVYKGSKPSTPASLNADDTAVSMKMVPFYLQPMEWNPIQLHVLPYDKMGAQWSHALNVFAKEIDNYHITNLIAQTPATSIIKTTGDVFTINAGDIDAFVLNPAFAGSLKKPQLADIARIEQLFNKQNFPVDIEKAVVVLDPTMAAYLKTDDKMSNRLTYFVNTAGDSLQGYSYTEFANRSQIGLYNPATGAFVDPDGVVPAGAVSAGMAFKPSQLALGIGYFDVFMVQSPSGYSYTMSANMKAGSAVMRSDKKGLAALTYGA
jgi:phage head maturation protease